MKGHSRDPGTRIGYVPGVFDMLHVGHLNIFRHARSACDHLIAGVVTDEHAASVKGRPPVVPLAERAEMVRHCSLVDDAVVEDVPKLQMWERLRFDVIFKGDDWRGTPKGVELERTFAAVGVQVVYFPYTVTTSSTMLRGVIERHLVS